MTRRTRFLGMTMTLVLVLFSTPANPAQDEAAGTVLITGANRGIGLALARRFVAGGYHVIGTARSPEQAKALEATGARVEQLDVSKQASVNALAERLDGLAIDILINNAGITGHSAESFAALEVDRLDNVLDVNTLGPMRVMQALLPHLRRADGGILANISSMMGSMELNTWGCCYGYRASKAALNAVTRSLALDHADQGLVFVVLHPGYVKTDMNDGRGNITPEQSAAGLFDVITGLEAVDNGRFYDWRGEELPW
jgi:NAD(P)-dependent dehydrogenase (short-subunit alcohol dehydrogenase family)